MGKLFFKAIAVFVTLVLVGTIVLAWVTVPPATVGAVILAVLLSLAAVLLSGMYLLVAFGPYDSEGGV